MKPVVVVLTPSIDLERNETSSTYTPGARYSGIPSPSRAWVRGHDDRLGASRRRPRRGDAQRGGRRAAGAPMGPQNELLPVVQPPAVERRRPIGVAPKRRGRLRQQVAQVGRLARRRPRRVARPQADRPALLG